MKLPFDKIYCLHLAESPERLNSSKEEFTKMGIYGDVDYWWTCKHPCTTEIQNLLIGLGHFSEREKTFPNAYNCTRNWYEIIKTSYLRGYEHILCIEDDFKFNISREEFETFMNKIPNDYDIIRFGHLNCIFTSTECIYLKDFNNTECFYFHDYNGDIFGTQMFALGRNGMKYYIDYMDRRLCGADWPISIVEDIKQNKINTYFSSKNFYNFNNSSLKSEIWE